MSDETEFEKIVRRAVDYSGQQWNEDEVRREFYLYGAAKRVDALNVLDDHLRSADTDNIRKYARVSKLRRDLSAEHQTLLKAGR